METTSSPLSNSRIDKLGERLKLGTPSDADLEMLSAYRNSFSEAANAVADVVRELSGLEVAVRPLKSTLSIVSKLKRDGVKKLSSMQDIGGCRVTVSSLAVQDGLVDKLMSAFPNAKLYDRVAKPSHGYRAKHLVIKVLEKRIEIQVRTRWQNQWALLSESVADFYGEEIKYGVGRIDVVDRLQALANHLYLIEAGEAVDQVLDPAIVALGEFVIQFSEMFDFENV